MTTPTRPRPGDADADRHEANQCPSEFADEGATAHDPVGGKRNGRWDSGQNVRDDYRVPPSGVGGRRKKNERPDPLNHATIDVYAMTNPALCGLVMTSFVAGAHDVDTTGVEFPLLFLPVPVVLSREIMDRFRQTNVSTGLFEWLTRHPATTVDFANRMSATVPYSRRGLLFAMRYALASCGEGGRVSLTEDGRRAARGAASSSARVRRSASISDAVRAARRLGSWAAEVRSTATVLHAFGVAVAAPR